MMSTTNSKKKKVQLSGSTGTKKESTPAEEETGKVPFTDIPDDRFLNADSAALKTYRENAGLTQKDIADYCGVACHVVTAWEAGKHRISAAVIRALASLYGVPAEKLARLPSCTQEILLDTDGNAIRKRRVRAGFSQRDVADRCGVLRSTVNSWENGTTDISEEDARFLANLFEVQPETLARKKPEKKGEEKETMNRPKATLRKDIIVNTVNTATSAPGTRFLATGSPAMEIPENPEERFCRNVLYYASEKGVDEEEFERMVGCDLGFFSETLQHNYKIKLEVLLKTAAFFGKSIEELCCDESAEEIKKQIADMERELRELRKKIGA